MNHEGKFEAGVGGRRFLQMAYPAVGVRRLAYPENSRGQGSRSNTLKAR